MYCWQRLFFVCFSIIPFHPVVAQSGEDTIYFDKDWSICEKPVAEYYRVGTLIRGSAIYYTDSATDYYLNGTCEMTGKYVNGKKQGKFIFYNSNGKKIKEGNYDDDMMSGTWSYYDNKENLRAQFNFSNEIDFTPLLIINNFGDTLLKNGNGKFSFDVQKDLAGIFPDKDFSMEGEVINGKKEGIINYHYQHNYELEKKLVYSETFKNGLFKKSVPELPPVTINGTYISPPFDKLNLRNENVSRIDNFYHSNIVFGYGSEGDQKLINFLLILRRK